MEQTETKRKAPRSAFRKGQSGNPGGRPKRTGEELDLIQACKDKTQAALDVIASIMTSGENERNRLAAAQAIIERAYGKPVQPLDQTIKATIKRAEEMTDDELAVIAIAGSAGAAEA